MSQYAIATLDSRARELDLRYQQTLTDLNVAVRRSRALPKKVTLSRWVRLWKAQQQG